MIIISHYFTQFKESKVIKWVLKGIRPATIGLIFSAVVFLAEASILNTDTQLDFSLNTITSLLDIKSTIVFALYLYHA